MARRTHKTTEAHDVGQFENQTLDEIGDTQIIEPVSDGDFVEMAELEKFMNDMLLIQVHPSGEEGELEVILPNVNGLNQPIIRGKEQRVRRKYVEACALSYYYIRPESAEPGRAGKYPDGSHDNPEISICGIG